MALMDRTQLSWFQDRFHPLILQHIIWAEACSCAAVLQSMPITLGPLLLQDAGDLVSTQNTTVTISACRFTGSSVSEQAFFSYPSLSWTKGFTLLWVPGEQGEGGSVAVSEHALVSINSSTFAHCQAGEVRFHIHALVFSLWMASGWGWRHLCRQQFYRTCYWHQLSGQHCHQGQGLDSKEGWVSPRGDS